MHCFLVVVIISLLTHLILGGNSLLEESYDMSPKNRIMMPVGKTSICACAISFSPYLPKT